MILEYLLIIWLVGSYRGAFPVHVHTFESAELCEAAGEHWEVGKWRRYYHCLPVPKKGEAR